MALHTVFEASEAFRFASAMDFKEAQSFSGANGFGGREIGIARPAETTSGAQKAWCEARNASGSHGTRAAGSAARPGRPGFAQVLSLEASRVYQNISLLLYEVGINTIIV